jgi:N-acylneuraminate cytidylyltransferase
MNSSKKYEVLAVIPARGGSKGVPGKNIKPMLGKPLLAYAIEAAKQSKLITRILVSTDDEKIAEVAKSLRAEVPFLRPAEISKDLSTDVEFLNHALAWLKEKENYQPEIVLRLPPTSPLRTTAHIDEGIQTLIEGKDLFDSVRPIVEASKHPYKMWRVTDRYIQPMFSSEVTGIKEPFNLPRQLLPKAFVHTGAMDVLWRTTLEKYQSTSGPRVGYFLMDAESSMNIDSPLDFLVSELLLSMRQKQ